MITWATEAIQPVPEPSRQSSPRPLVLVNPAVSSRQSPAHAPHVVSGNVAFVVPLYFR